MLGVLFVADQAAPSRSFIPMLFLGLAVALATFYLAFVVPGAGMWPPQYDSIPDKDMWTRLNYVSTWVRRIVFPRASALRAAVISLFFGLAFLPVGIAHLPPELSVPLVPVPAVSTPAAIVWPEPRTLGDPDLSVVLYTAQLEEFRERLPPATSATPDTTARDNAVAWSLALVGFLIIALIAWNPFGWWKPEETAQVQGPDTLERDVGEGRRPRA